MFVCLGNICRSPLAHALFEKDINEAGLSDIVEIESSGTGAWHLGELPDSRMRKEAASHGVEMTHRARKFQATDLDKYDLVLAMDESNYRDILSLGTPSDEYKSKVRLFREFDPEVSEAEEVPDPYYGGREGFKNVYDIVQRTSLNIVDKIKQGILI
jgi:protein-tyrosine phosphatase